MRPWKSFQESATTSTSVSASKHKPSEVWSGRMQFVHLHHSARRLSPLVWFLSTMRGRRCSSSWLSGWRCLEGDEDSFQLCSAASGGEENKVNSPFSTAQQQALGLAWQLCENAMQPSPHADEKSTPIWSSSSSEWVSASTVLFDNFLHRPGLTSRRSSYTRECCFGGCFITTWSSCEFRKLQISDGQVVRPLSIPAADPFGSCATGNGQAIRWMHFLKHQIKAVKDAILGVNFWRKHTFLWFFQNLLGQVSKWCCFNIMLERSEPFKPVYWASFESEALAWIICFPKLISFCLLERQLLGTWMSFAKCASFCWCLFFLVKISFRWNRDVVQRAVKGASQIALLAMTFVKATGVFCKLTLKLMRLRGQYLPEARCKISFCKAL